MNFIFLQSTIPQQIGAIGDEYPTVRATITVVLLIIGWRVWRSVPRRAYEEHGRGGSFFAIVIGMLIIAGTVAGLVWIASLIGWTPQESMPP